MGRAALYAVEFKGGHTVTFVVIYGWTGGAQDAKAANRTSDMFEIIFNELKMQPDGPKFVVGNSNVATADITSLNLALLTPEGETHAWHDIGALAELWGQMPCEPICKAYNANKPTRRDYVIANTEGLGLVESFEVSWKDLFAVHATIQFTINVEALE